MKKLIFVIPLLFLCIQGCIKSENGSSVDKESAMKINAGFMCGWGAGEDSLYISSTIIKYVYYVPAESLLPKIKKSRPTTYAEWADILDSFDPVHFVKLDYNTCNICVDGCDEWISVQNSRLSHQIRFGLGSKIDSLNKLQDILANLRAEFRR